MSRTGGVMLELCNMIKEEDSLSRKDSLYHPKENNHSIYVYSE